jgi:hypothetical protein
VNNLSSGTWRTQRPQTTGAIVVTSGFEFD